MRKIRRYIIRNWFWIVLGLVLTRKAMEYCYRQRGSFQVGGEFFILPVILMAVYLIPNIVTAGKRTGTVKGCTGCRPICRQGY